MFNFWGTIKLLSHGTSTTLYLTSNSWGTDSPTSLWTLAFLFLSFFLFFFYSHPRGYDAVFVVLICISLVTNNVENVFMWLLTFYLLVLFYFYFFKILLTTFISSWRNIYSSFCLFLIGWSSCCWIVMVLYESCVRRHYLQTFSPSIRVVYLLSW